MSSMKQVFTLGRIINSIWRSVEKCLHVHHPKRYLGSCVYQSAVRYSYYGLLYNSSSWFPIPVSVRPFRS